MALAAGYLLDYSPEKDLEKVAAIHHRKAVTLLGQELNNEHNYQPGHEDALIAAILLLYMVEVSRSSAPPHSIIKKTPLSE